MDDLLQQGIDAFKSGDKAGARKILTDWVSQNPDSERGWGWLFNVCVSSDERIHCLQQVVRINPNNTKAAQLLDELTGADFPLENPNPSIKQNDSTKKVAMAGTANRMPIVPEEAIGSYISSILLPNEKVLAVAKVHWMILILPALFLGILILATALNRAENSFGVICIPMWFLGIYLLVYSLFIYITTEFALTDKRVIGKSGILKRQSLELVLSKVESIQINQSLFERIYDIGTLTVTGTGGTTQIFKFIAEPMKMKTKINTILAGD